MSRLTRDKIDKLLGAHNVGNFTSLISKKDAKTENSSKISIQPKTKIEKGRAEPQASRFSTENNANKNKPMGKSPTSVSIPLANINSIQNRKIIDNDRSVSIPLVEDGSVSVPLANQKMVEVAPTGLANVLGQIQPVTDWANLIGGKAFDLMMYLVELCEKECSLRTPPVFSKDLIAMLSVSPEHLRNLIVRLTEKKMINIVFHKSGRHALRVFEFEKEIYSSLALKKNKNSQKISMIAQSLVDKEKNEVNNYEFSNMGDEVSNIDISPMEAYGFNTSHIIQIYREYKNKPELRLSEEIIQDSINAMAFDLQHNNVKNDFKNAPTVVLVSLLKKGKPYSSKTPEKFVSPQVAAMREYVDAKSKEQKELNDLENKSRELALKDWLDNLPEEELMSFYHDSGQHNDIPGKLKITLIRTEALKNAERYFVNSVWLEKRKQLLGVSE